MQVPDKTKEEALNQAGLCKGTNQSDVHGAQVDVPENLLEGSAGAAIRPWTPNTFSSAQQRQ